MKNNIRIMLSKDNVQTLTFRQKRKTISYCRIYPGNDPMTFWIQPIITKENRHDIAIKLYGSTIKLTPFLILKNKKKMDKDDLFDKHEKDFSEANEHDIGHEGDDEFSFTIDRDTQEDYYERNGYIKVAESDEEDLENWDDGVIGGCYELMNEMICNIKTYLDSSIIDEIFQIIKNDPKYRYNSRWNELDTFPGVEIIENPIDDRCIINMSQPTCYVDKSLIEQVRIEYCNLVDQFEFQMKHKGYTSEIKRKIFIQERIWERKKKNEVFLKKKKEQILAQKWEKERKELERKRKLEAKEHSKKLLSEIANYLIDPVAPFFCAGPVLCTSDNKVLVITKNHMYTNYDHSRHHWLILKLQKLYDCMEIHEFHRDNREPFRVGRVGLTRFVPNKSGWGMNISLLQCVSGHYIDVESIRNDYINWLSKKDDS